MGQGEFSRKTGKNPHRFFPGPRDFLCEETPLLPVIVHGMKNHGLKKRNFLIFMIAADLFVTLRPSDSADGQDTPTADLSRRSSLTIFPWPDLQFFMIQTACRRFVPTTTITTLLHLYMIQTACRRLVPTFTHRPATGRGRQFHKRGFHPDRRSRGVWRRKGRGETGHRPESCRDK